MHPESFEHLKQAANTYLDSQKPTTIIDIGSMDVNGSYRAIFNHPNWRYIGLDISAGKNVDLVMPDPYRFPLKSGYADLVISGQAFEHIDFFWITWLEIARILKPGGIAILILPQNMIEHRYPVDCWRFLPDAMTAFSKWNNLLLEKKYSYTYKINPSPEWLEFQDTVGIFKKPPRNIFNDLKTLIRTWCYRHLTPKNK